MCCQNGSFCYCWSLYAGCYIISFCIMIRGSVQSAISFFVLLADLQGRIEEIIETINTTGITNFAYTGKGFHQFLILPYAMTVFGLMQILMALLLCIATVSESSHCLITWAYLDLTIFISNLILTIGVAVFYSILLDRNLTNLPLYVTITSIIALLLLILEIYFICIVCSYMMTPKEDEECSISSNPK